MDRVVLEKFIINGKIQIINSSKTTFDIFVKAVHEEDFLAVGATDQLNFRPIQVGQKVEFLVSFETEAFRCASQVLEVKMSDQAVTVLLSVPEIILRVERRQFIRLQTVIPVSYYLIPDNEFYRDLKAVPLGYWKRVKNSFSIDISGGGMKIVTYEDSEIARGILLQFSLKEEIRVLSSVVRVEKDPRGANYRAALKFEDIKLQHRDLIIRYINGKSDSRGN